MYNNSNYVSKDTKFISEAGDYINYRTKDNEWKQVICLDKSKTYTIITGLLVEGATELYIKRYKEVKELSK